MILGANVLAVGAFAYVAGAAMVAGASYLAWATGAAGEFGTLQYADRYGVMGYNLLRSFTNGTGLKAHHVIEQRFAEALGWNTGNMLSVAVTDAEHAAFTSAWQAAIPYGTDYTQVTANQLWFWAQQIYAKYPADRKSVV